jgi:hypothetical protein
MKVALRKAGIAKHAGPHSLRHYADRRIIPTWSRYAVATG